MITFTVKETLLEPLPNHKIIIGKLYDDTIFIGNCKIILDYHMWTITGWYIEKQYQNKGFGNRLLKETFQYLLKENGIPDKIDYVWDGTNQYVYDWLVDNFDAYCDCPIAVQKYSSDDDWTSHIYHLNVEKIFSYFNL